jgi:hypothetical protein
MILVDSPNTLLVFSRRTADDFRQDMDSRDPTPKIQKESGKNVENVGIEADDEDGDRRVQIAHSSVYTIRPNQDLGELIVDFVLVDKPHSGSGAQN